MTQSQAHMQVNDGAITGTHASERLPSAKHKQQTRAVEERHFQPSTPRPARRAECSTEIITFTLPFAETCSWLKVCCSVMEGAVDGSVMEGAVDGSVMEGAVDGSVMEGAVDGVVLRGVCYYGGAAQLQQLRQCLLAFVGGAGQAEGRRRDKGAVDMCIPYIGL